MDDGAQVSDAEFGFARLFDTDFVAYALARGSHGFVGARIFVAVGFVVSAESGESSIEGGCFFGVTVVGRVGQYRDVGGDGVGCGGQ